MAGKIGFAGTKQDTSAQPALNVTTTNNGRVVGLSLVGYDPPSVDVLKSSGSVAQFGADNQYPQHTIYQFENSPTHAAICRFTATLIAGMGFVFEGATDAFKDNLGYQRSIDRIGKSLALDLKLHNGWAVQVMWSADGTRIAKLKYEDFSFIRKEVNSDEEFTGTYLLYKYWKKGVTKNTPKVKPLPQFDPEAVFTYKTTPDGKKYLLDSEGNKIKVLDERGLPVLAQPNQLFYYEGTSPGQKHYPKPMHIAADTAIQINCEFDAFHIGNIMNGMTPSLFIEAFGSIPDETEQDAFESAMQKAFKGKKGKKSFIKFTDDYNNKTQITPLDIKNNETRYLELMKFFIGEICSAHMLSSPVLAGIAGTSSLNNSGTEIEAAFRLYLDTVVLDMQDQLIEGFQEMFDQSGMTVKVGIIAKNPFGDVSTTTTNDGTTDVPSTPTTVQ